MISLIRTPILFIILFQNPLLTEGAQVTNFNGLLGKIAAAVVNRTLNKFVPFYDEFTEGSFSTATEELEFGKINLTMKDVKISGINNTVAEVIRINFWPFRVENITLHLSEISFSASDYTLDGYLKMPNVKEKVPLYGSNGSLSFSFHDVRISAYMRPKLNASTIWMENPVLLVSAEGMKAENLMGGTALGRSYNTIMNDTGIDLFKFYKDSVVAHYLEKITYTISVIMCVLFRWACWVAQKIQVFLDGLWVYHSGLTAESRPLLTWQKD